jgi:streptogrisin C
MRRRTALAAAIAATLAVSLLGAPVAEGAQDSSGTPIDERAALADALVQDFGISKTQALANVDVQGRAGDIVGVAEKTLGDGYAGVWFDNATGKFRVGVAPSTDRDAAKRALEAADVAGDADLVPVDSTWAQLEAARDDLTLRANALIDDHQAVVGINAPDNAVQITLAQDAPASALAALHDAASRASIPVEFVAAADGQLSPVARTCSWPYCDKPLGGAVEVSGSRWTCTAGFFVRSLSDELPYLLTAGHCFTGGSETWTTYDTSLTLRTIGPRWNSTFGSAGDAGIVRINSSYFNVSGGYAAKIAAWTTGNGNYRIVDGRWSYYGLAICRYGRTTARQCGSVNNSGLINISVNVGGTWVAHETFMTACASSGDSGGPIVASNHAYGLLSTSQYNCPNNSGSYFEEVQAAAPAMHTFVASG